MLYICYVYYYLQFLDIYLILKNTYNLENTTKIEFFHTFEAPNGACYNFLFFLWIPTYLGVF